VLVINFDEWGGFYDHVLPPKVIDDTVAAALTPVGAPHPDYTQLGHRVPCIVVSPFSAAKVVHAGPYEHTSVLKMIEWRWGLDPLTARDANAKNLAEVLDFSLARTDLPTIPQPTDFVSVACGPTSVAKSPPAPIHVGGSGGSNGSGGGGTGASGGGNLPATGPASTWAPAPAAAAALAVSGMAVRAAHRRATLSTPEGQADPVNSMLGLSEPALLEEDE
jgi:hypothetical protein